MVIKINKRMRIAFIGAAIVLAVTAAAFALIILRDSGYANQTAGSAVDMLTVIVDPGHGGEDGGATAADGTVEKDINLSISLKLRDMLDAMGYNVIMTRETDADISDPSLKTIRQSKV